MDESTIIFASDAAFPDATSFLSAYLAPHGYRVIPARTPEEVLEIIGREPIACVVLMGAIAVQPLPSGDKLIRALPARMPMVVFAHSRVRAFEWLRQCDFRRNQEYGGIPFDVEDLLLKVRKVIAANNS